MSSMKKRLIGIAVLLLCAVGVLLGGIIAMGVPTQGNRIEKYSNPQKALLVIDIQEDYTGTTAKPPFPYKDSEKLIAKVNKVIEKASGKKIIIVYIRQEFDSLFGRTISKMFLGGTAIKGNPGTDIDKRISIISKNSFSKPKGDAFSNPELDAFLIKHHVNELYLTGLDAEYCVHSTAKGALNRGYSVKIITDCIALQAEKKWDDLVKDYEQEGIDLLLSRKF